MPLKPVAIRFAKNKDGRNTGKSFCCLLSVDGLKMSLLCHLIGWISSDKVTCMWTCAQKQRSRGPCAWTEITWVSDFSLFLTSTQLWKNPRVVCFVLGAQPIQKQVLQITLVHVQYIIRVNSQVGAISKCLEPTTLKTKCLRRKAKRREILCMSWGTMRKRKTWRNREDFSSGTCPTRALKKIWKKSSSNTVSVGDLPLIILRSMFKSHLFLLCLHQVLFLRCISP